MSALYKLQKAVQEQFPTLGLEGNVVTSDSLMSFIDEYCEEDRKRYLKNKEDRCLSFGKHAGFKISQLCQNEKGKSYVQWLLKQSWFNADKYPELFEDIEKCGIKKNTVKFSS